MGGGGESKGRKDGIWQNRQDSGAGVCFDYVKCFQESVGSIASFVNVKQTA